MKPRIIADILGVVLALAIPAGALLGAAGPEQTALGLAVYELAAERAARGEPGPGTFRARLLDEVAALGTKDLAGLKIASA